jgi:hypothetical protein
MSAYPMPDAAWDGPSATNRVPSAVPQAEPRRRAASQGLADRAVVFAMFALAVVGVVRIGWFLLVP